MSKSERGNQGREDYNRAVKAFHMFLQTYCNTSQKYIFHVTSAHQYDDCSYLLQAFKLHIHTGLLKQNKKSSQKGQKSVKEHDAAHHYLIQLTNNLSSQNHDAELHLNVHLKNIKYTDHQSKPVSLLESISMAEEM